jgi:hypothetical protein
MMISPPVVIAQAISAISFPLTAKLSYVRVSGNQKISAKERAKERCQERKNG